MTPRVNPRRFFALGLFDVVFVRDIQLTWRRDVPPGEPDGSAVSPSDSPPVQRLRRPLGEEHSDPKVDRRAGHPGGNRQGG